MPMDTPEEAQLTQQILAVQVADVRRKLLGLQAAKEHTHDPERLAGLEAELVTTVAHVKDLQAPPRALRDQAQQTPPARRR